MHLHESPGEEGNTNHHSPAGNETEAPDGVPEWDTETELSKLTVKWVEVSLVRDLLLVLGLGVDGSNLSSGDRGSVKRENVDIGGGLGLVCLRVGELHVQDSWGTKSPGVAENRVGLAAQDGHVRRVGRCGDEGDRLVELGFGVAAETEAGLVASGQEEHEVLGSRRGSRSARSEDLLVVLQSNAVNSQVGDLCSAGIDRVRNGNIRDAWD